MRIRRNNKLLIEPPSVATGDIAFNLIVFFLVCASTQPDSGRRQDIPRSDQQEQKEQQSQNIEVAIDRISASINGERTPPEQFVAKLKAMLDAKATQADKVVVVKSAPDTSYTHWVDVTGMIEEAGGIVTLQLEEEQTVISN